MSGRSLQLNMGYENSWGLLDDVDTAELEAELERLDSFAKTCNEKARELANKSDRIRRKRHVLSEVLERRRYTATVKSFVVTDDHRKLLSVMDFRLYKDGGDYVFIGVDGKRPLISSGSVHRDVAEILGWTLPNDDLSNDQYAAADQLIYELPIALNKILALEHES